MLSLLTERERINIDRKARGEPLLTRSEYRHLKALHAGAGHMPETFHEYAVTCAAGASEVEKMLR